MALLGISQLLAALPLTWHEDKLKTGDEGLAISQWRNLPLEPQGQLARMLPLTGSKRMIAIKNAADFTDMIEANV